MPKKAMACFVTGLKKNEKVPHQVFHRPSVPVGFWSFCAGDKRTRKEGLSRSTAHIRQNQGQLFGI